MFVFDIFKRIGADFTKGAERSEVISLLSTKMLRYFK